MRKILLLLAALMLLLCGCTGGTSEQTEPTAPQETKPAEYYVQDTALESQTQGAICRYALPEDILWIKTAGKRLLVGTESGLQLLEGDKGTVVASTRLDAAYPDNWEVLRSGFAYYDPELNSILLLDDMLTAGDEILLTEEMQTPVISPDGKLVYYCTGQEIRVYEVQHKISRLLKSQTCTSQKLVGTYFDGKVLACNVVETIGDEQTVYISTANGETLSSDSGMQELYTAGDQYFAVRSEGVVLQRIVGQLDGEGKLLTADDDYVAGALELDSVIGYAFNEEGTLMLNLYNAQSGQMTACADLAGFSAPSTVLANAESGCIWLLTETEAGEEECLLRWKPKQQTVGETVYLDKLYTSQSPDQSGLKELEERISKLNSKHGVRIRIWQEAVKVTEGHNLKAEHQISAITQVLDELEEVFREFPSKFIQKSISSRVRICIVRSIDGEAKATQFWSGKYAFIVLSPGVDVRSEFLKGFGFVVDSHVLGNSPMYDYWNDLNPEGFAYGGAADGELATGENRAFVDVDSMTSGTVDRSRIFWQAMQPNNGELFSSEIMQKKLNLLCKAIRDAWRLEKSTEIYAWEQYLTTPIAAQKK